MMPKTRVRPAAIRNSMIPNCRPFSVWISSSVVDIAAAAREGKKARRGRWPENLVSKAGARRTPGAGSGYGAIRRALAEPDRDHCRLPLHGAVLMVGVLIVFRHQITQGDGCTAFVIRDDVAGVPILHWKVVVAEAEVAADRAEVCLTQGIAQSFLVGKVAIHRPHRGADQACRVIALSRIDRRDVAVGLLEVRHEALLGRGVRTRGPEVRAGVAPHHLGADGRQPGAVDGRA